MEFGVCTFADVNPEPSSLSLNTNKRFKELLEEIKFADELGLEVFGIGEHHRADYTVSAPEVVLGAAAAITKNIKLTTAVTVLSSDDPVRVYERFSTIDQISSGRAEIMAGRGSFIESFPLFGYDLDDYNELFSEKLELLLKLNESEKVTWKGNHRKSFSNLGIYPRPFNSKIPVWIAVGGTPESAVRAGKLGLPLTLAIIGGQPEQFVPFINLYRSNYTKSGHDLSKFQLGINSHCYISDDFQKAGDEFYPAYSAVMSRIGKERGWGSMSREAFDHSRSRTGALLVGSPEEVAEKIIYEHKLFGNTRFLAQMSIGTLSHEKVMRSMELFATKVIPIVKENLNS